MSEQFPDEIIMHDGMPTIVGRNGKPHLVRDADFLEVSEDGTHFESTVPATPEGIENVIPVPPRGSNLMEAAEFAQGLGLLARALKDEGQI